MYSYIELIVDVEYFCYSPERCRTGRGCSMTCASLAPPTVSTLSQTTAKQTQSIMRREKQHTSNTENIISVDQQ